ncbi:ATP-binding cassette domain-containing protein [Prauserella cavernicola]|uniref:ATP-binding cassette domain-containing protein n=1 Tax=Prauserella cavernicola TaxID=2800127 RepID=A0A934V7R5_9PSEU|nr:ATP-binding cassette domain-containing protein [Prauserella cavernicola]MBK1787974.1 ATP-binding cassette domain-containing protein [Prauserella cavernicola]
MLDVEKDREPVIWAEGLTKRFGKVQALDGLDLSVPAGTCYGLLGPNGAGKTTAVRVFATITRPDGGEVRVAGHDVVRDARQVRRQIGLAGQHAALDEELTGRENLQIIGRLFHLGRRTARRQADHLLEKYSLDHAADRLVKTYSGGMRRRLDLIASLIISPTVLFLDEPTAGLDPRSRLQIWETVRALVADGTTVMLTTQYLDEADQLAAQIAVVDAGTVVARGTPDELKAIIGSRVDVALAPEASLADSALALRAIAADGAVPDVDEDGRTLSVPVAADSFTLPAVVRQLDSAGIDVLDVGIRRPTLDEVFLTITGNNSKAEHESLVP